MIDLIEKYESIDIISCGGMHTAIIDKETFKLKIIETPEKLKLNMHRIADDQKLYSQKELIFKNISVLNVSCGL